MKQTRALREKIEHATSFLLLTHTEVDHDAICSLLILSHILRTYFRKKEVSAVVQEGTWPQFESLDLPGIESIKSIPVDEALDVNSYDLVFILDVPYMKRCASLKQPLHKPKDNLIIIDHHETEPEENALYINEEHSSTAEQIYLTFKEIFPALLEDKTVAYLVQVGILGDTDRFLHGDVLTPQTFRTFGELYEKHPINIEQVTYNMTTYPRNSIDILCHIIQNITYTGNMAYSSVEPSYVQSKGYSFYDVHIAKGLFTKTLLRSLEGVDWGFLVYKADDSDNWKVSFRAKHGTVEVFKYAQKLGGGGHEYAAGGDVSAPDVESAVKKVLEAIGQFPTLE